MGYPMSYGRAVSRNGLKGDYGRAEPAWGEEDFAKYALRAMIAGDLRRLEQDSRDELHLAHYAKVAGISPEQVKLVLDEFFDLPSR